MDTVNGDGRQMWEQQSMFEWHDIPGPAQLTSWFVAASKLPSWSASCSCKSSEAASSVLAAGLLTASEYDSANNATRRSMQTSLFILKLSF